MLTWNKNIEKEKLPVSTASRFFNRTNLQLNSYGNLSVFPGLAPGDWQRRVRFSLKPVSFQVLRLSYNIF